MITIEHDSPPPFERNCQQFFRSRRAKSSWKHAPLTDSFAAHPSFHRLHRFACVRRTVALRILRNRESRCARFQPRIYERLRLRLRKDRGDTNLLERFSWRERGRDEVAEGRGERSERVVLSSKRFLFESIKLIKMTTKNFLRLRLNGLIDVS